MIQTQPRPVWERGAVDHGRVARAGDGARAGAGGVGGVMWSWFEVNRCNVRTAAVVWSTIVVVDVVDGHHLITHTPV